MVLLFAGRVAGHISGASFELNNQTYHTSPNGNDGTTTVDGGERGWSRRPLDVASHTSSALLFVIFDRAGQHGFPGTAASSLAHSVFPYEWRISYGVTPSRTSGPIPLSLSLQTFWNLDGFAPGSSGTVAEHALHLPFSGLRLDEDRNGVPTGDIKGNAKGSRHDFWSQAKTLAEPLHGNDEGAEEKSHYDSLHLINRQGPWSKDSRPVASLSSPLSGISMDLYTDREAVRVRTWDDGAAPNYTLKESQGGGKAKRNAAVSLQMQDWPDALNHPEWQRDDHILFGPDGLMTSFSSFKFSVRGH